MLLRQWKADEPTLPDHHEAGAKEAVAEYQGARDLPAGFWVWQKPYWFVFRDGPGRTLEPRQWGPEAACGPPDAHEPGAQRAVWSLKRGEAKSEWLLLEYDEAVKLVSVEVHETLNPGALASIAILRPNGELVELWRAAEAKPVGDKERVLKLDMPLGFQAERVLLRFDSKKVAGRTAIDAVGLKDDKGKLHWAARAEASSSLAEIQRLLGLRGMILRPAAVPAPRPLRIELDKPPVEVDRFAALRAAAFGLRRAGVLVPAAGVVPAAAPGPGAEGDAEKMLRERVAELEAKVVELEESLARERAKARK
jgi:hypothetical protein